MRVELIEVEGELALKFTPEMREHLGLEGDEVEIELRNEGIVISTPVQGRSFEAAKDSTFRRYHDAFKRLADS